jgi:hypothetical protein
MEFSGLVKSLVVPAGYTPPTELIYDDIHARAISRADLTEDVNGINRSRQMRPCAKNRKTKQPIQPLHAALCEETFRLKGPRQPTLRVRHPRGP